MQYRFTQNLGTDDARFIREKFHEEINHKECVVGSVVELGDEAASYLKSKYKALLEPVDSVKAVAKKPELTGVAK